MIRPFFLFAMLLFSSCNPFALKPLNIQIVENGKQKARWFFTSSITTLHYHVEIDKRDEWIPVMETGDKIDSVFLNQDTVVVRLIHHPMLYEFTSVYWGTYVRLDEEGW